MSSHIPFDIITRILSNLDIKTLLCFRSVSKGWRSLIDSSGFINTHMSLSIKTNTNNTLLILGEGGLNPINFDDLSPGDLLNLQDQPFISIGWQDVRLMGSCNGLVCLSNDDGDVVILNQSTREHKRILSLVRHGFELSVGSAPDKHWVWVSAYGFGYDAVSNDYKFVSIAKFLGIGFTFKESEMTIYSAKKDLWGVIKIPYDMLSTDDKMGVYVHGSLHWIAKGSIWRDIIVGFDLGLDEFREVPQPDYGGNIVIDIDLGVLGSYLCVFAKFRDRSADVWIMKEYGVEESWSKVFSISRNVLFYDSVRPLSYSRRGTEVLLELDEERLVWYGMETRRVVDVVIQGRKKERLEAVLCLNSLVPPDGNDRVGNSQQPTKEQKKNEEEEVLLDLVFLGVLGLMIELLNVCIFQLNFSI
ncbi:F-box protein CPR30-like [Populus alba x Populus x berolinensis]|uniref:F-box protein CPR30-like n=1 Tax=Populus alba x Populus x berolinensis TaxID=444605 RepID=A0AAD6VY24_9ROSI|nr:F-box protein CPR30-like [Populus alba x Populus x berolinensis]